MKLKAVVFAATALLSIACAATQSIDRAQHLSLHAEDNNTASVNTRADPPKKPRKKCDFHCNTPYWNCVQKCKDTSSSNNCEQWCNCQLFSDPKFRCITEKCTKVPENCPKPMLPSPPRRQAQPPLGPPPTSGCVSCTFAINSCTRKCRRPGAFCDLACACHEKKTNPNCARGCNLPDDCEGIRRPSELLGEDAADLSAATSSRKRTDAEPSREEHGLGDEQAMQVAPAAPINPILLCESAIHVCQKQCRGVDGCNEACNCLHAKRNRNCRGANILCNGLRRRDGEHWMHTSLLHL